MQIDTTKSTYRITLTKEDAARIISALAHSIAICERNGQWDETRGFAVIETTKDGNYPRAISFLLDNED